MTVMVLRLKGGGETLRKGFDALNHALAAMGAPQLPPQRHQAALPPQIVSPRPGTNGAGAVAAIDPEEEEQDGEEAILEATAATTATAAKPRNKKPSFNSKLNLAGTNKSWKHFSDEKSPGTVNDCYLVAALWLTEQTGSTEFVVSDVFTLFRAATWDEQVDFSQPLRQMKNKKSYFEHPTAKTWKLTQPGMDAARAVTKSATK
jgi:hypothetical protein